MKTIGIVLGVLALLLAPLIVYRMFEAQKSVIEAETKQRALDETFTSYATAVEQGNFKAARDIGTEGFKEATSWESFRALFAALERDNGRLKRVRVMRSRVRGRGTGPGGSAPLAYTGHVECEFEFEQRTIRVMHEFHEQDGRWMLHGFKAPWTGSTFNRDLSSPLAAARGSLEMRI